MRHAQTLNEAQFRKVLHYCRTRRHANRDTAIFMVSFFAGFVLKKLQRSSWGTCLTPTVECVNSLRLRATKPRVGSGAACLSTNVSQKHWTTMAWIKTLAI